MTRQLRRYALLATSVAVTAAVMAASPINADAAPAIGAAESPCEATGCPITGTDWDYSPGMIQGGGTSTITDGYWTCQTTNGWQSWNCANSYGTIIRHAQRLELQP